MVLGGVRKDVSIRNKEGFMAGAPGAVVTLLGHCGHFCQGTINSDLCGVSSSNRRVWVLGFFF